MIGDIPIVMKVRPTGERTLRVRFAGDRREYVLDLTGLIARSGHFAPLMEDADTFGQPDQFPTPLTRKAAALGGRVHRRAATESSGEERERGSGAFARELRLTSTF